jgi:hypothetical protein
MHIVTRALLNSYGDMSLSQAGRTSWPRLAAAQLSRVNVNRACLNLPDFLFCSACRKEVALADTDSSCRHPIVSYAYGFVRRAVLVAGTGATNNNNNVDQEEDGQTPMKIWYVWNGLQLMKSLHFRFTIPKCLFVDKLVEFRWRWVE